jgi:phytoene synthase
MAEPDDLDAAVRAADPDRWLASRFIADPALRADVIAIYAFDTELRRIPQLVTEPLMAEIRLTWWREGIEAIAAGRPPPSHPVLIALAGVIARHPPAAPRLQAMAQARLAALDGVRLDDAAAVDAHVAGTAGAVMGLATGILGVGDATALQPLGKAWWIAEQARDGVADVELIAQGRAALAASRPAVSALPPAAFPAVAYAALAGPYFAGRRPGPLETRLRLLGAVLTGRV